MVNLSFFLLSALTLVHAASSPPWYPSPEAGTVVLDLRWKQALQKAQQVVANMTLPEKVNVTTGVGLEMGLCVGNTGAVDRLGIKSFCLQDGPLGIRHADKVTVFPAGIAMASTFSRDLVYRRGAAMGRENKRKGVDIHLGPVVGPLGRHAQAGRNWEGFSADCYLAGKLGAQSIMGTQSENVLAVVKHLVGNEQEHFRQFLEWKFIFNYTTLQAQVSSNIDDRTMNEAYLWPFADAVRANVGSVMCSYQQVNGTGSCENSALLNGKLKHEMGFQGFVMSDWYAQQSGALSALSGLDMSMPGQDVLGALFWGPTLTTMVLNGTVDEARLDDMVTRILTPLFYVKIDGRKPNFSSFTPNSEGPLYAGVPKIQFNQTNTTVNYHVDARDVSSQDIALESAQAAVILLKNDYGLLPILDLPSVSSINVFGIASQIGPNGPVCAEDMTCSDGALITGWGSGSVYPTEYQSPYEALRERAMENEVYVSGTTVSWNLDAVKGLAAEADINVIYVLADSGEGLGQEDGDRRNVSLWHNGDELIKTVASMNRNNIVVVTTVGPIDMEPWIDHVNVSAVVLTGPAGDFGGKAIASVIFGDYSPSGKLPFTIAKNITDYIPIVLDVPKDGKPQSNFSEGTLIDYKRFDHFNTTPRYEFGYGLSYSNFSFADLDLQVEESISEFLPSPALPLNASKPDNLHPPSISDARIPPGFKRIPSFVYPWVEGNVTRGPPFTVDTNSSRVSTASGGVGGNPMLWSNVATLTHSVNNQGPHGSSVVAQMYISFPQDFPTAPRQLRGFDRTPLMLVGETRQLHYNINWRDLAVWDPEIQSWRVQRGEYTVYVGRSSRDVLLTQTFVVK